MKTEKAYFWDKITDMRILSLSILSLIFSVVYSQNLPLGYITHFQSDFSAKTLDTNLLFSPSTKVIHQKGIIKLEFNHDSLVTFKPPAVMLVNNNIFGDFISEITFSYTENKTDSTSGVFLIFGLRNINNYYIVNLSDTGTVFYKMYEGKLSKISSDPAFVLKKDKLLKLRVERNILERSLTLKLPGKTTKLTDPNLVMGYIGLGCNSSILKLEKLIIWAPTSLAGPLLIFNP